MVVAAWRTHATWSSSHASWPVLQRRGPNSLDAWRAWLLRRLPAELACDNAQSCLEGEGSPACPL